MNDLLIRIQSDPSGQMVGWDDFDLRSFSHFRYDPTRDGDSDSDSDDSNSDSTDSGEGEGDQVYFPRHLIHFEFRLRKESQVQIMIGQSSQKS